MSENAGQSPQRQKIENMKDKSNLRFSTEPANLETKQQKASFF